METSGGNMLVSILVIIVIGGVIGWLASLLVKGRGLGLAGDIVVGIIGSFLGGWLLPRLGVSLGAGLVGTIITGVIGAVIVLLIVKMLKRA
jgi:uncharacterized membrane protein YeaQ/YmgE (transglycosylase-associated protein family)